MTDSNAYPTAQKGEETVRDVLLESFPVETREARVGTAILPLKSRHLNLQETLAPFCIRTSAIENNDLLDALHFVLQNTTSLTPPDMLFSGPKVSQALLGLYGDGPDIASSYLEKYSTQTDDLSEHFNHFPLLDIVPRHEGETLSQFLYNGKDEYDYEDPTNNPITQRRASLIEHFLTHEDALFELFEHAAFVGLQPHSPSFSDLHDGNVMVNPDTLHCSLIDMVPPEDQHRIAQSELECLENAYRNISTSEGGLHHILTRKLLPKGACEHVPSEQRFEILLDQALERTKDRIQKHEIGHAHPEWKGFTATQGVQAIPLDAPSWVLRDALDKLYAQAVPEQSR